MTDFDGTLVPIRERPEYALPSPGILKTLSRLTAGRRATLAVVSGRDVGELKRLIPVDGIYLVGCHGAEYIYPGGEKISVVDGEKLDPFLDLVAGMAADAVAKEEGFILERKKAAFAMHYRLADPVSALRVVSGFTVKVRPLIVKCGFVLMYGRKVVEVRPRYVNKGKAVKRLMQLNPGCFPVYLGDDVADEDAFRVIQAHGMGVLVSESGKSTAACCRLRDQREVLRFLQIVSSR